MAPRTVRYLIEVAKLMNRENMAKQRYGKIYPDSRKRNDIYRYKLYEKLIKANDFFRYQGLFHKIIGILLKLSDYYLEKMLDDKMFLYGQTSLAIQGILIGNKKSPEQKEAEEKERKELERVGLKVIASGFFDSERIDRQLEGRTGRNGISGIVERFSSPEDLLHLGLERVHDEPLMKLFNRTPIYGDGSLKLSTKDYDRLRDAITNLQKANDTSISESIEFTQDISAIATNEMEKVRDRRRQILEYTKDEETLIKNEKIINDEIKNMLTMTIDNLLVSYMRNKKFESRADIIISGSGKEQADIDYEGLRLALIEQLGLRIDINSFKNSDTSILEFRNALLEHMKNTHDILLKTNKKEQLERDVYALLHKDDYNISSINTQIDYIRKQKSLDYITGNEQASNKAIISMNETLNDLKYSSCKAGTRILFGTILPKNERKELKNHREKLFGIHIINNEPIEAQFREDDSKRIGLFRSIANKVIENNISDRDYIEEKIIKKITKGKNVDIPSLYSNLRIRPMA